MACALYTLARPRRIPRSRESLMPSPHHPIPAWGPNSVASRSYAAQATKRNTTPEPPISPGPSAGSGAQSASSSSTDVCVSPQPPLIAFISGPLEADTDYFNEHYAPSIVRAIESGHHFIVGPARGVDALTLAFLLDYKKECSDNKGVDASRISVYLNDPESRNPKIRYSSVLRRLEKAGGNVVSIQRGGHTARDAAMTRASHYDILRYRTEKECRELYGAKYRPRVSGTEKNEIRRRGGAAKS